MEKIIQLSEKDYNELTELAALKKKQIESRALKLYQKQGVDEVKLIIDIVKGDSYSNYEFKTESYFRTSSGQFTINEAARKRFTAIIENEGYECLSAHFGKCIHNINHLNDLKKAVNREQNTFRVVTILGWLVALSCMVGMALL